MIFCFGVSWPVAVCKTLKTKQVQGKSLLFIALVASGYGFGVIHKVLYNFDSLIFLYGFNLLAVLTELGLCVIYGSQQRGGLTNAYAAADTLFGGGKDTEIAIQRQLADPIPNYGGEPGSAMTLAPLEIAEVAPKPTAGRRRARNRNSGNHLQQDLWPGGLGDQVH